MRGELWPRPPGLLPEGPYARVVGREERVEAWRGALGGDGGDWTLVDTTGLSAAQAAALLSEVDAEARLLIGGVERGPAARPAEPVTPERAVRHWVVAVDEFWAGRLADLAARLRPERVSLLLPFPSPDAREADRLLVRSVRALRSVGVHPGHCYVPAGTPLGTWRVVTGLAEAARDPAGLLLGPPVADARRIGMAVAAAAHRLPMVTPPSDPVHGAAAPPHLDWLYTWKRR